MIESEVAVVAELCGPRVETGNTETVLSAQVLHRHARVDMPQKSNELFFCVAALFHVRRAPMLTHPLDM